MRRQELPFTYYMGFIKREVCGSSLAGARDLDVENQGRKTSWKGAFEVTPEPG